MHGWDKYIAVVVIIMFAALVYALTVATPRAVVMGGMEAHMRKPELIHCCNCTDATCKCRSEHPTAGCVNGKKP